MAFSSSLPCVLLRYVPWCQQPSYPVEDTSYITIHIVSAYKPDCKSRSLVHLTCIDGHCVRHLRAEDHILL